MGNPGAKHGQRATSLSIHLSFLYRLSIIIVSAALSFLTDRHSFFLPLLPAYRVVEGWPLLGGAVFPHQTFEAGKLKHGSVRKVD